jgi:hypothetical protein
MITAGASSTDACDTETVTKSGQAYVQYLARIPTLEDLACYPLYFLIFFVHPFQEQASDSGFLDNNHF